MQRGTHKLTLLARHTIPAGEELTISYVPLDMPRGERQKALRLGYGFWCDCVRCEREKEGASGASGEKEKGKEEEEVRDTENEGKVAALAGGVDALVIDGEL